MMDQTKQKIAALLSHEDPHVRRQAAEDLAADGSFGAIAALASALGDENTGVRDAASQALLAIGGPNVPRVIVEYITARNFITRNLAGDLLIKCGEPAVQPLLPYLQDPDRDVRKFAVDILGLIKNQECVKHVVKLLDDSDENVVVSAVEALGNIRSPEAVRYLENAFERYEYARVIIAEAMGKIGDPSATEFLQLKFYWTVKNKNTDPLTLFSIIEALSAIGNQDALTTIHDSFDTFQGKLRSVSLHAMIRISERLNIKPITLPSWKHDYIRALNDDDIEIQKSAVQALTFYKGSDVTRVLLEALGRSSQLDAVLLPVLFERDDVFITIVEMMEQLSDCLCTPMITMTGQLVRNVMKDFLRKLESRIDEDLLRRLFDEVSKRWIMGDVESRGVIVDIIFRLDGDRAIEFLDEIRKDPDPWIRLNIIELVADVADRRAPQFISQFLEDEETMVQELAASILQTRGLIVENSGGGHGDVVYVS
jgi:HEAT repeat protein